MVDDRFLTGGVVCLGLSGLFFYGARRIGYALRLALRTPLTPTSQVQEGMVQVAGRAVGRGSEKSFILGLNCLVTQTKIEVFYKHNQRGRRWQTEWDSTRSAPFYVEDASGLLYVDPGKAEFALDPDVEMEMGRWWRSPEKPRPEVAALQWTAKGLEARVCDKLFDVLVMKYGPNNLADWMKRAAMAGHSKLSRALDDPAIRQQALAEGYAEPATGPEREKLEERYDRAFQTARRARKARFRVTEKNLLPGHAVYVLGPAFSAPDMGAGAHPMRIRKEHPDDTFLIGEGTPAEVHARVRWETRKALLGGLALAALGAFMILKYCWDYYGWGA